MDFHKIVEKFGKPGTLLDMISDTGIVLKLWVDGTLLKARILFLRNIGREADLLTFDQEEARRYRVNEWRIVSLDDAKEQLRKLLEK